MSARTDYWPTALGGIEGILYTFNPCVYYVLERDNKKYICSKSSPPPDQRYKETGDGFELDFNVGKDKCSNFFILDIDCTSKCAQYSTYRNNRELAEFIRSQTDVYSEKTINGGYHLVFNCTSKIFIQKEKAHLNVSGKPSGIVFEFKHRCLVWPTANYTPICSPAKIARHTFDEILSTLVKIRDHCLLDADELNFRDYMQTTTTPALYPPTTSNLAHLLPDDDGNF